jgi:hypothetical protein
LAGSLQSWNSFGDLELEPIVAEEFASEISVCDLGSGRFVGKRISVKALVYHVSWNSDEQSEDFIFVYPLMPVGCSVDDSGQYDPLILTELDLQNYFGPHSNLEFELGPFEREVDVHIVGTVSETRKSDSLIKYKIQPEKIELISPWRGFSPKGAS